MKQTQRQSASKGPPKKRRKQMQDSSSISLDETHLRRSSRSTKGKTSDWWKAGKNNQTADDVDSTSFSQPLDDDSDSESALGSGSESGSEASAESVNTYCPPTRRQRSDSQSRSASKNHNRNRNNANSNSKSKKAAAKPKGKPKAKAKPKQRKEPPKPKAKPKPKSKAKPKATKSNSKSKANSKSRNKKVSDKAPLNDDSDEDDDVDTHHKAELEFSTISPSRSPELPPSHRRRPAAAAVVAALPPKTTDLSTDAAAHALALDKLLSVDITDASSSMECAEIIAVLKETNALRHRRAEMDAALNSGYRDIVEQGRAWRAELNDSIAASNAEHAQLKADVRRDLDALNAKIGEGQIETDSTTAVEGEYAVLYESAQAKISAMTAEIAALSARLESARTEREGQRQSHEAQLREMERTRRADLDALRAQHKLESEAMALKLKCAQNERAEFEAREAERRKIVRANEEVLIENLRRENAVLKDELDLANQRAQTVDVGGDAESAAVTPSPMRLRLQSELARMGAAKSLEATVQNLQGELERARKETEVKRGLLGECESAMEAMRAEIGRAMKRLALYEMLTATKLEVGKGKGTEEERFECRTLRRDAGAMMQFGLRLGSNDKAEDVFLDYSLGSVHNLPRPGQPLCDEMSFFAKDAPLFLKAVILHAFASK